VQSARTASTVVQYDSTRRFFLFQHGVVWYAMSQFDASPHLAGKISLFVVFSGCVPEVVVETLGCGGPGCRQRATFERVSGIATISEYHAFIFLSVCFRLGGRFLFVPVVKRLI